MLTPPFLRAGCCWRCCWLLVPAAAAAAAGLLLLRRLLLLLLLVRVLCLPSYLRRLRVLAIPSVTASALRLVVHPLEKQL